MTRVLTSLGMILVLLSTMASTGFVSNGYQKVYAQADFPNSDLGAKIRESINAQIKKLFLPGQEIFEAFRAINLILSGFPHQTGESVTNIHVNPTPCVLVPPSSDFCNGFSNIVIPGIGKGNVQVFVAIISSPDFFSLAIHVTIDGLPGQTGSSFDTFGGRSLGPFTRTIDISGIGTGQATVELIP